MANDDKVEMLDKEVQTMLRCMPHFLTANQNSSVVQDSDCQTAISAKPTTSLTCMLTVLEYADPETFRMEEVHQVPSECEDMYPSRVPELDTENSNLAEIFNYSDVIDGITDVDELFNLLLTQEDGSGNPLFNKCPPGENSEWDDDVILEEEEDEEEEGEYAADSDDKPSEPDDKPSEPDDKPSESDDKPSESDITPAQSSNTPIEPDNKSADPDKTPDHPKSKPNKHAAKYIEPSD